MNPWIPIDQELPPDHAMCLFFVPKANYIWGLGCDHSEVKRDHPSCTHYKVITDRP